MTAPDDSDDIDTDGETLMVSLDDGARALRLDKALAEAAPTLSRARIQALMDAGAVSFGGAAVSAKSKAVPGDYIIALPPVAPADPQAEAIALNVLYEDADLIVIDKPAGMAAHPAPGTETGTAAGPLAEVCAAAWPLLRWVNSSARVVLRV